MEMTVVYDFLVKLVAVDTDVEESFSYRSSTQSSWHTSHTWRCSTRQTCSYTEELSKENQS